MCQLMGVVMVDCCCGGGGGSNGHSGNGGDGDISSINGIED